MKGPLHEINKPFHEMDADEKAMAVKLYRVKYDLTQREFAKKAGVGYTTIVYIENWRSERAQQKKLSLPVMWKIEKLLEKEEKQDDCEA